MLSATSTHELDAVNLFARDACLRRTLRKLTYVFLNHRLHPAWGCVRFND